MHQTPERASLRQMVLAPTVSPHSILMATPRRGKPMARGGGGAASMLPGLNAASAR